MVLEKLTEMEEIIDANTRCRNAAFKALSNVPARELAHYFGIGDENQRIIYRDFLKTQPQEYREEFNEHLTNHNSDERKEYNIIVLNTPSPDASKQIRKNIFHTFIFKRPTKGT